MSSRPLLAGSLPRLCATSWVELFDPDAANEAVPANSDGGVVLPRSAILGDEGGNAKAGRGGIGKARNRCAMAALNDQGRGAEDLRHGAALRGSMAKQHVRCWR
jgi:hypothetical protein